MRSMDLTDLNNLMRLKYIQRANSESPLSGRSNSADNGPVASDSKQKTNDSKRNNEQTQPIKTKANDIKEELTIKQIQNEVAKVDFANATLESDAEQIRLQTIHQREIQIQERERAQLEIQQAIEKQKKHRLRSIFRSIFFGLLLFLLIALTCLGLYRLYRWSVESPLIKEVVKKVEVPVETIVEKEKIVEKEVIPDECTQIRRNGKVYVSCDGVKIDGANTIGDSGVNHIPELITE